MSSSNKNTRIGIINMKKVALVLAVILGVTAIQPVQASEKQTIAIIDSAIDSSKFSNIVYEACFTLKTCPNGQTLNDAKGTYSFSEGKGSAAIQDFSIKGSDHGFNMAKIATYVNPNINIVFIRISDEKVYDTFSMIRNDGGSLARALAWVSINSSRLNIKAVSISQSRSNFAVGTCPTDALFESSVAALKSNNIATFVSTGNDGKKNQIGFPSCVSGVYPVTGAVANGTVIPASNENENTKIVSRVCIDFIKTACVKIPNQNGVMTAMSGTSVATVVAATLAVGKNNGGNWDTFISSLPKVGKYSSLLS
jgi:hypothetical protein